MFALLLPAGAMAAGPTTSLVSVSSTGAPGNSNSFGAAISKDGRFIAFASRATNLVDGDTNNHTDIFLRDRKTGVTSRISVANNGTQADNDCFTPMMSADGHFVYFLSYATSLVSGPAGEEERIYRYDRLAGTLALVPLPAGVSTVDDENSETGYSVDADGGRVAFVGLDSGIDEVYWWDAASNALHRVSETAAGVLGNTESFDAAISGDGTAVGFTSGATNFVSPDANGYRDVFVKNLATGAVDRISSTSDGGESNLHSSTPALDYDGCWAAFFTDATNLVAGQSTQLNNMVARDRCGGTGSQLLTLTNANTQFKSRPPLGVSDNGCRYVFLGESFASAWMRDRCTGVTTRIDLSSAGDAGDGSLSNIAISGGTGRYVAIASSSDNLVPGDGNGVQDIFVRDLAENTPPVAALSTHVEGAQVTADGAGSSDPDGYQLSGSINWGDGTPADTGLSSVHTYAHSGTFGVTLLVTDSDGATSVAFAAVTVGAAAGGGSGGSGAAGAGPSGGGSSEVIQLILDRLALAKSRFLAGSKVDSTHGSSLALRLSAPATVTLTFERALAGRTVKGACKPGAKKGKRCTKLTPDGSITRVLPAGSAELAISGALGTKKLAVGTHRLTVQARGTDGQITAAKTVTFTIVKPKKIKPKKKGK